MKPWLYTLRAWLLSVCQSRAGYRSPAGSPHKP